MATAQQLLELRSLYAQGKKMTAEAFRKGLQPSSVGSTFTDIDTAKAEGIMDYVRLVSWPMGKRFRYDYQRNGGDIPNHIYEKELLEQNAPTGKSNMSYTEKKEREKLNVAMTCYRVFLYFTTISTALLIFYLSAVRQRRNNIYFTSFGVNEFRFILASLFLLPAFAWHLIGLQRRYLIEPSEFRTRPTIITSLLLVGFILSGSCFWQLFWTITHQTTYGFDFNRVFDVEMPTTFLLVMTFHTATVLFSFIVFGMFSSANKIHNTLELTNQTSALVDSDPLGIADELKRLKTPGTGN